MSRSFKKTPVCKDPCSKWMKRQASKAVRRYDADLNAGGGYRKVFCSWNLCDYRFIQTKQQAALEWERDIAYRRHTLEQALMNWHKYYRRK
ncbi:hypothetical protein GZH47_19525 [Paenibacillus rhizovicinus]|uniref:Uncharacterized protein n=2 Tax=Paenibacillus rhizovicinus TaxID=2704463 RepID=A0A6C0PCS4_9BACL|nr:hypothetical protein GZH47_19525 [Paenibacillus rhizovicinus]